MKYRHVFKRMVVVLFSANLVGTGGFTQSNGYWPDTLDMDMIKQWFAAGQLEQIEKREELFDTYPEDKELYRILSTTYSFLGNETRATKYYEKLLRINPHFKPARTEYELFYLSRKFSLLSKIRFGGYFGSSFSKAKLLQQHSHPNAEVVEEKYHSFNATYRSDLLPLWNNALYFELNFLNWSIPIGGGIEFKYWRSRYYYQGIYNIDNKQEKLSFGEDQGHSSLSVYTVLNIVINEKMAIFPYLGGSLDYRPFSEFKGFTSSLDNYKSRISVYVSEWRSRVGPSLIGGVRLQRTLYKGVFGHLHEIYLLANVRYTNLLGSVTKSVPGTFNSILEGHFYRDNDLTIQNIAVNIGIGFTIFEPVVKLTKN